MNPMNMKAPKSYFAKKMILKMMGYKMSGPNCCIGPRSDWGQSFKQALLVMSRGGASTSHGRHEAPVHFLGAHQAQARSALLPVRACIGQSSTPCKDADDGQANNQNQQQAGDYGQDEQQQQPALQHQEPPLHGTCIMCMAAPAVIFVVGCGHLCFCVPCSEQARQYLNMCPMCRCASLDGNGHLMLKHIHQ